MDYAKLALERHENARGKIEITSTVPLKDEQDLSTYYTPRRGGPVSPSKRTPPGLKVHSPRPHGRHRYRRLRHFRAGQHRRSGRYARHGGQRPSSLSTLPASTPSHLPGDPGSEEIIATVKNIAPGFGGINLEDIAAPACFEVERRLKEELNIPVFHDDQHGTAIVTCAALYNALRLTGRSMDAVKVVINGAGAAGCAIAHMLQAGLPPDPALRQQRHRLRGPQSDAGKKKRC